MKLERPTIREEKGSKERLSATLEEHLKNPRSPKRNPNYGAQMVKVAFRPIHKWLAQIEKKSFGREALGFIAMAF